MLTLDKSISNSNSSQSESQPSSSDAAVSLNDHIEQTLLTKLSSLLELSKLLESSHLGTDVILPKFDSLLTQLEADVKTLTGHVDHEFSALEKEEKLEKQLGFQKDKLKHLIALVPSQTLQSSTVQSRDPLETEKNASSTSASGKAATGTSRTSRKDPKKNANPGTKSSGPTQIALVTEVEFSTLPHYIVGRLNVEKINAMIQELNKLISDKYTLLRIPQPKMNKLQSDIYWEHKQLETPETRGRTFITEGDLKSKRAGWSSSGFKFDAVGRNVLTILRHLGRMKEVRGGKNTRIVLM